MRPPIGLDAEIVNKKKNHISILCSRTITKILLRLDTNL